MSNLVTQGSGNVENVLKVGYFSLLSRYLVKKSIRRDDALL